MLTPLSKELDESIDNVKLEETNSRVDLITRDVNQESSTKERVTSALQTLVDRKSDFNKSCTESIVCIVTIIVRG